MNNNPTLGAEVNVWKLYTVLNGNPVSDASEVRRANIWLMIPKVANFWGLPYAPYVVL